MTTRIINMIDDFINGMPKDISITTSQLIEEYEEIKITKGVTMKQIKDIGTKIVRSYYK